MTQNQISLKQLARKLSLTEELIREVLADNELPFAPPENPSIHLFTPEEVEEISSYIKQAYIPEWTQVYGPLSEGQRKAILDVSGEPFSLTDD